VALRNQGRFPTENESPKCRQPLTADRRRSLSPSSVTVVKQNKRTEWRCRGLARHAAATSSSSMWGTIIEDVGDGRSDDGHPPLGGNPRPLPQW